MIKGYCSIWFIPSFTWCWPLHQCRKEDYESELLLKLNLRWGLALIRIKDFEKPGKSTFLLIFLWTSLKSTLNSSNDMISRKKRSHQDRQALLLVPDYVSVVSASQVRLHPYPLLSSPGHKTSLQASIRLPLASFYVWSSISQLKFLNTHASASSSSFPGELMNARISSKEWALYFIAFRIRSFCFALRISYVSGTYNRRLWNGLIFCYSFCSLK